MRMPTRLPMNLPAGGAFSAALRGRRCPVPQCAQCETGRMRWSSPRFMAPIRVHHCRLQLPMNPLLALALNHAPALPGTGKSKSKSKSKSEGKGRNRRESIRGSAALSGARTFRALGLITLLLLGAHAGGARAADAPSGEAVECANFIYAGTKSSVCFSEEFLSAVAAETSINPARKFKPVKLADREAFRYPFAVMTGEGGFTLTDEERKNLRLYLEKGGFLLASAGCSSKEWSGSFTREIGAIFPDRKLDEVALSHPIFRTLFDVPRLDLSHGGEAKLRGLTLGGKIVLIFSADGLNDTGTMHGCCCCGGNEVKNSQKVNANILTYALLQ